MANLAAILPAAKAPLEVQEVEKHTPGPTELLIKNEVLAYNAVEFKIAKLNIFPLEFPTIIGSSFGGRVEAVGSQVKDFQVGDRVVAMKKFDSQGNQYGAYQRYVVIAADGLVSKVAGDIDLAIPASVIMNLATVVGLFAGRLGLDRPKGDGKAAASKGQKILVYGGSSGVGSLTIQYLSQAGYTVVTTSSPRNHDFVSGLGAAAVVDHTLEPKDVVGKLQAEGPYDIVVDTISLPPTIDVTAALLAAQDGGKLYAMQPAFGPETLPAGVERVFESWPGPLYEEDKPGLLEWFSRTYFPQGITNGAIVALPVEKVAGGLEGVNEALDKMMKGVSGARLVADPWEGSR